ncbi:hypothetical protein N658DRAFT_509218 [Parathielavia hyrcaniae]|uniref:Uncharacterized protein n=1 Tax=Parathielavia hyrcaniae TaxID=113614 RepID=A0AAN6PVJ9_9PEZI|nr:hypothetical protein N658DRAFT_509218 [Parathielavia hyrcaniae]
MPSLPLKAQIGIRDHWIKDDSPVQKSLRDLQELLGHSVVAEPEWPLLVAELDAVYADKANLVAVVASCVQVWVKSMMELLDDSACEAWAEKVLDKAPGRMRVLVDVARSDRASTTWSEARGGFVVSLPKKQVYQPAELFPIFREELLACFNERKKPQLPEGKAAGGADSWEDVEVDAATGKAEVVKTTPALRPSTRSKVVFLPDLASLPRPDQLFLQPPYHLSLTHGHREIELQCSHSPSLQLLADYLKRWCRVNHADTRNPPSVQVTLHQSAFGLGEMFDRLTISTEATKYTNQFTVTSPMMVTLIEGVLGYELVSTNGAWHFRRDTALKTL